MKKGSSRFVPLVFSSIDILLLLVSLFFAKYQVFDGHVPYPLFYNTLLIGAILFGLGLSLKFQFVRNTSYFFYAQNRS